ncbi:MAG: CPBP family intramembrane metalloprotease [Candidatus Thorarchaeota archaeon]
MIEWVGALILGLGISMVIYFVSFSLMVAIAKRAKQRAEVIRDSPWRSSMIVSPLVLCFSLLVIFILSSGMLPFWGFQLPPLEIVGLLSIIGLIMGIFVVLASESFSPTPEKMSPPSDTRGRIFFFIAIVLLASISEEVLFRGFVQNIIDNTLLLAIDFGWFSISSGAIVSALLFGIVHIAPARQTAASVPVLVSSAFILGLIAGIFLTLSGSLLLSIVVHIEFNLIGFILVVRR